MVYSNINESDVPSVLSRVPTHLPSSFFNSSKELSVSTVNANALKETRATINAIILFFILIDL
jgi:hypothetical protein